MMGAEQRKHDNKSKGCLVQVAGRIFLLLSVMSVMAGRMYYEACEEDNFGGT